MPPQKKNTAALPCSFFQPEYPLKKFLQHVAYGEQDKAEQTFTEICRGQNEKIQQALCYQGELTDHAGRTFHCSAYEYAYWAKDTHMCRMLARHMDNNTKREMLARIEVIEAKGLSYHQNGKRYKSKHFELTALITALKEYDEIYRKAPPAGYVYFDDRDSLVDRIKPDLLNALKNILKEQLNVPAHVAHEYCRRDRSFYPCPLFKEPTLPRSLTVYHYRTLAEGSWFSSLSDLSNLAYFSSLVLARANENACLRASLFPEPQFFLHDLNALACLDAVRTADLNDSRNHLLQKKMSYKATWV